MNCDWVKSNIALYVYDELADDGRFELEQHVTRCGDCARELEAMRGFRGAMAAAPVLEPSPNLLAASRMKLQEALETAEQHRGWRLLDPAAWLRQMRFSPALASALLIIGFASGILTAWRMVPAQPGQLVKQAGPNAQEASIAGIREIVQNPGSNQVEIKYDTLVPEQYQGSLDDRRVQQLLLYAARNNNSGVRQESVNLLSQQPGDARIREALKASLLYDTNPGVRLKSLDALGAYVKDDASVRDAVLAALQTDHNPGVRAEAIRLLQPVKADSSVRLVLQRLAQEDQSEYIRKQAGRMMASLPQLN
jgi:hypothetical protein